MEKIKISKIEGAKRQLLTAIKLWFDDDDEVAVHALACAAYEVIHDINHVKKGPKLIFDSDIFVEEYRKKAVAILKAPGNFFKHGDFRKNKSKFIEFSPQLSEFFILFSLKGLQYLGEKFDPMGIAFSQWIAFHKPHLLNEKGRGLFLERIPIEQLKAVRSMNKGEFLETFMAARVRRSR